MVSCVVGYCPEKNHPWEACSGMDSETAVIVVAVAAVVDALNL